MLSVLLGTAFLSRQFLGWVADRVGGLDTPVLVGSALQIVAMAAFMLTQDEKEVGLFTVAAAFGLGFAGIIPAFILAIRELFPVPKPIGGSPCSCCAAEAAWQSAAGSRARCTIAFGTYMLAFAAGVAANAVNLAIVGVVLRQRRMAARRSIP